MALDMFLYRVERPALPYINESPGAARRCNPAMYIKMKPFLHPGMFETETLLKHLAYWSAAQVHEWILRKLQVDHFYNNKYMLSEEWLRELFSICLEILQKSTMEEGTVVARWSYIDLKTKPGPVIANPEIAAGLLPLQEDNYCGVTLYNGDYMAEIAETVGALGKALYQTDFSTHAIVYSWM